MPTKLYRTLSLLSREERENLGFFFRMPEHELTSTDQAIGFRLVTLMNTLEMEEECLWKEVLRVPREVKHRQMISRLLKVTEKYLLLKQLREDPVLSNMLLANFYQEEGLQKHADQAIRDFEKTNDEKKNVHFNYYHNRFKLTEMRAQQRAIGFRQKVKMLYPNIDELDMYVDWQKARILYSDFVIMELVKLASKKERNWVAKQLRRLGEQTKSREALIYFKLFELRVKPNEAIFRKLYNKILDENLKFTSPERREVLNIIMGYCAHRVNSGVLSYARKYIELIELQDKEQLLLVNGQINIARFKNTVTLALISKQYEWGKRFVREKGDYLKNTKDYDAKAFQKYQEANIALYQLRLDECLEDLSVFRNSKMYRKEPLHKYGADKILLKALFLKKEHEAVKKMLPAFRTYLEETPALTEAFKHRNRRLIDWIDDYFNDKINEMEMDRMVGLDQRWLERVKQVYKLK